MIRFISFEGGDGSGKTTQLRLLEGYLRAHGKICVCTREPGGTGLGKMIRQVLLGAVQGDISSPTELFLYLADRAQHVEEIIQPALRSGRLVLCDRFIDSTLAYQGYGRGIDLEMLRRVNFMASRGLVPDLTILLDCPVGAALARKGRVLAPEPPGSRASPPANQEPEQPAIHDRFEGEGAEFHERVRQGFLELARAEPNRIYVVDASLPIPEVQEKIRKIVDVKLTSQ